MVAQKNRGGTDALLLRNLYHRLGTHQRSTRAAQGTVGHNMDALLLAQIYNLLLRKTRVVLDLVDGGDDLGLG